MADDSVRGGLVVGDWVVVRAVDFGADFSRPYPDGTLFLGQIDEFFERDAKCTAVWKSTSEFGINVRAIEQTQSQGQRSRRWRLVPDI